MFNKIIGVTVRDVGFDKESLWINFANQSCLTVYNRWKFRPLRAEIGSIVGCELSNVAVLDDGLEFSFVNQVLTVDVSDDGYNSPEALVLTMPGEPIVVWN